MKRTVVKKELEVENIREEALVRAESIIVSDQIGPVWDGSRTLQRGPQLHYRAVSHRCPRIVAKNIKNTAGKKLKFNLDHC